jgi:hypothetical protein
MPLLICLKNITEHNEEEFYRIQKTVKEKLGNIESLDELNKENNVAKSNAKFEEYINDISGLITQLQDTLIKEIQSDKYKVSILKKYR